MKGSQITHLLFVIALCGALAPTAAWATASLKQVQVSNGSQVDLLFDAKVQKGQLRTEFINDIIQISIQDAAVYPAKISSVNGTSLTKIFAYQYSPRLVRCRLTVKGKAEAYKNKLQISAGSRILTVRLGGAATAKHATAGETEPSSEATSDGDAEEKALLSRVIAAGAPVAPAQAAGQGSAGGSGAAASATATTSDTISTSASAPAKAAPAPAAEKPVRLTGPLDSKAEKTEKIAGAKPLPSPLRAFGKMAIVLALFGALALGLKRYASRRGAARLEGAALDLGKGEGGGIMSSIGRLARKGLSRDGKMIQVLSTHYLGPKKSIAVVRVQGRTLVLGVSNESINLITQLSGEEDGEGPAFSELLRTERSKPAFGTGPMVGAGPMAPAGAMSAGPAAPLVAGKMMASASMALGAQLESQRQPIAGGNGNNGVRAQIRSRLEGLKPL